MVCLVLLIYLLTSVMWRLALMLSPSFLGVRTTLLHQSVGSSPTSVYDVLTVPSVWDLMEFLFQGYRYSTLLLNRPWGIRHHM